MSSQKKAGPEGPAEQETESIERRRMSERESDAEPHLPRRLILRPGHILGRPGAEVRILPCAPGEIEEVVVVEDDLLVEQVEHVGHHCEVASIPELDHI